MRPFHLGSMKSKMSSGKSASVSRSVLYTTVRARPDIPTHLPVGDLAQSGTRFSTESGNVDSMSTTAPNPPGSWAKKTSAGVWVTFLQESGRQLGSAGVVYQDLYACGLGELLDDGINQRLAAARIYGQGLVRPIAACRGHRRN